MSGQCRGQCTHTMQRGHDSIGMEDKPDGDKDSVSLKPPQTETRHKERSRRHRSKPYLGAKERLKKKLEAFREEKETIDHQLSSLTRQNMALKK